MVFSLPNQLPIFAVLLITTNPCTTLCCYGNVFVDMLQLIYSPTQWYQHIFIEVFEVQILTNLWCSTLALNWMHCVRYVRTHTIHVYTSICSLMLRLFTWNEAYTSPFFALTEFSKYLCGTRLLLYTSIYTRGQVSKCQQTLQAHL